MKYNFLRFPGGKAKAVTLSYDDGNQHDIRFLETIREYGLKCTFNLVGNKVEKGEPLSADFIRENILSRGHEIAIHGDNHRALNRIRPIEGIRDVLDCRLILERKFGIIVRGMAFPDCSVNRFSEPETYRKVKEYLVDLEVAYARGAGGDNDSFLLPEDWHNWMPTAHHDNPKIMEYIEKFVQMDVDSLYKAKRTPKLFYLWGHSFEFDRHQNWDHLQEICQKLGNREDVWYATNIEIYDYVQAFQRLQYSADGSIVKNPTLLDLWFDVDKVLYCVKSGETLMIQ